MNPIKFHGATHCLGAPKNWSREELCEGLWVSEHDNVVTSCWKPTWRERLRMLLGKPVWLHVVGGQPPVSIEADSARRT
jgi:hypothetical protein